MISYAAMDPQARFLYEKAGRAAYCAYRRLELDPDQNFEDARQEAALTFWDAYRRDNNEEYAFVAARNAVLDLLRGHHNPYRTLSLDYQGPDDKEPWGATLPAPAPQDQPPAWLHEVDLLALVHDLFDRKPPKGTIQYNADILRLLVQGCDTAAIAVALGRTENAVKQARKKLKAKLAAYCQRMGIEPPAYERNGGGWRPAHHYAHWRGELHGAA